MASPKRVKNETIGAGSVSCAVALALLLLSWSRSALPDEQPRLKLAPINLKAYADGTLGYTYLRNTYQNDVSTQHTLDMSVAVGVSARTFIWQPWIARVYGYIGLSTSASAIRTTTTGETVFTKSGNEVITGSTALHILPQSRFPFRAEAYRDNTQATGFLTGVNASYISQGYSLNQTYRTLDQRLSGNLNYSQNTSGKANLGAESAFNQLSLSLSSQPTSRQTFQLFGSINNTDRPTRGDHFLSDTLVANHSYLPNTEVAVSSLVNLTKTNLTVQNLSAPQQNDFNSQQLYSFASWRPEDTPLTVTGSARLLRASSSSNGIDGVQTGDTNFNLGANYAWSRFLRIYGSVNINDNSGVQTINTNAAIAAQKGFGDRFDPMDVGGFRYTRSVGATLSNQTITTTDSNQVTTTSSSQALGLNAGHALDKEASFGGGRLKTGLNQALSTVLSTSGTPATRLGSGGSLSWSHSDNTGTTISRLSANDSRALNGKQNFFQIINLQASRNQIVGRNQSLIGNLTAQATRSGTIDSSTPFIATPSADISYHHERLFKVKNLVFDSVLKVIGSDIVLSQNVAPQDRPELNPASFTWDNNLGYYIGLLKFRLNIHFAEVNNTTLSSLLFTMTRTF